MIKLILSALVPILTFAFWVWQRYYSKSAKIAKLETELTKVMKEIQDALEAKDMPLHYHLDSRRLWLSQEIRNLRR